MNKQLAKVEDAKLQSLPQNDEFLVEKLDFSELAIIKGGKDKKEDTPSGNNGRALFCICK